MSSTELDLGWAGPRAWLLLMTVLAWVGVCHTVLVFVAATGVLVAGIFFALASSLISVPVLALVALSHWTYRSTESVLMVTLEGTKLTIGVVEDAWSVAAEDTSLPTEVQAIRPPRIDAIVAVDPQPASAEGEAEVTDDAPTSSPDMTPGDGCTEEEEESSDGCMEDDGCMEEESSDDEEVAPAEEDAKHVMEEFGKAYTVFDLPLPLALCGITRLGAGASGHVHSVLLHVKTLSEGSRRVVPAACKVVRYRGWRKHRTAQSFRDEVAVTMAVQAALPQDGSPAFVVRCYGADEVLGANRRQQGCMYLEPAGAGTLQKMLGLFRDRKVKREPPMASSQRVATEALEVMVASLLLGLRTLNVSGFAHGDLKLANVGITRDGRLVLLDLGSATPLYEDGELDTSQGDPMGTWPYAAPEVLNTRDLGCPTRKIDMYSLGVILAEAAVYGVCAAAAEAFLEGQAALPDWVAPDLADLIKGLTARRPWERLSLEEALAHPFLKGRAAAPEGLRWRWWA